MRLRCVVLLLELSVGENTSLQVGITKWEPPQRATDNKNLLLCSRVWFGCAAARLQTAWCLHTTASSTWDWEHLYYRNSQLLFLETCFFTSVLGGLYTDLKCNLHIGVKLQSTRRERWLDPRLCRAWIYGMCYAESLSLPEMCTAELRQMFWRCEEAYGHLHAVLVLPSFREIEGSWSICCWYVHRWFRVQKQKRWKEEHAANNGCLVVVLCFFLVTQTVVSQGNCLKWVKPCILEKWGSVYTVTAARSSCPGAEELEPHQRVDETPVCYGSVERSNYLENTGSDWSLVGQQKLFKETKRCYSCFTNWKLCIFQSALSFCWWKEQNLSFFLGGVLWHLQNEQLISSVHCQC